KVRAKAGVAAKTAAKAMGTASAASHGPSEDAKAIMACMTEGFARLEKSIQKAMARA
ncbi:MAG: hypothetical protein JO346_09320, partial [Alphaproteobacteria bacterium]|nr:hypothetical protein [Alphaproteobacteria bacterium]